MKYLVNVEAAIVRDGRYLLIVRGEREAHAPGMLSLPGGKVERVGDAVGILEDTLRREIQEEVGVEIDPAPEYLESTAFVAASGEPVVNIVFLCRYQGGVARRAAPDEVARIAWLTAAEVLADANAPPWTRRSIELAEQRSGRLG